MKYPHITGLVPKTQNLYPSFTFPPRYWLYKTKTHVLKTFGTGAVTQTIAKLEDSADAAKLPWSIDKLFKPDKINFE